MAVLSFGKDDGLYYEYFSAGKSEGVTFVFFNAITSDTKAWEAGIAPALRSLGYGTLTFNYRGQTASPFSEEITLDENLIVTDAIALLQDIQPQRPLLVGLSIGGLFAAKAYLSGAEACGIVLINTLRRNSARLKWVGDALVRSVSIGGLELFRDLFLPLLMNEDWQDENRQNFLKEPVSYTPLEEDSGHFKLLSEPGRNSNWDLPYEDLKLPCLIITGLQDHVFLDSEVVDSYFSRLPAGQRIDFPEAGHLLPAEIPEKLVSVLTGFVKEVI